MRIPHTSLKPDTLRNVIEHFVMREGTDYGAQERTLESKIADVLRLLETGRAFVTYDEASESCSIVSKDAKAEPPPKSEVRRDDGQRYDQSVGQRSYDEASQESPQDD